jgi:flagellar basal-body rod modification protein FlgD
MNVDMTTSIPAGANQSSSARSKAMVDYNSFLKLLIAQMKNQDPTQPMDSTQYVAQLATFSQVEQSMQANTKLDQILQASSLSQATSLIGHSISSLDGEVSATAWWPFWNPESRFWSVPASASRRRRQVTPVRPRPERIALRTGLLP